MPLTSRIPGLALSWRPLAGDTPMAIATVGEWQWTEAARLVRECGGRLVALWGSDRRDLDEDDDDRAFAVHAAYAIREGLCIVELLVPESKPSYPDLSGLFAPATRMQRALFDLVGVAARGASDTRPWLRHGAWPEGTVKSSKRFSMPLCT